LAPQLTVSVNGAAATTGAITCDWEDTIRIRLASTAGVRSCRFEIYGYPDGWTAPTGWTEDTDSRVIYATSVTPADFDLPTLVSYQWGKWLLRAIVDGATDDDVTALEIVSTNGLHALPAGEGAQFGGAAQRWGKDLEANLRTLDSAVGGGGAPSGAAGGDLGGTYPNPSVVKLRGLALDTTLGSLTTPGEMMFFNGTAWVSTGAPSNPTQLLIWRDSAGYPSWADPSFEAGVDASAYWGQAVGGGFALSASAYSVAGSGALGMASAGLTAHTVRLTGALTGNRVCTLPAGTGQEHLFTNATTGTYTLQIAGPSGGSCYLAPGQSKRLSVDDAGVLRGEGLRVWEYETTITNVRGSAGSDDTTLCAVPLGLRLSCTPRVYQVVGATIGGGAPTITIGTSAGGTDVMDTTGADGSSDVIIAPTAGSGIDADGGYPMAAAATLSLRNTTPGTVTVGTMRIIIVGLVLA